MPEKQHFDLNRRASEVTDLELAQALYGGKYTVVGNQSQWKKANPERAEKVRQLAQANGMFGLSWSDQAKAIRAVWDGERQFTPEEHKARSENTYAECSRWYRGAHDGTHDLAKLRKDNPAKYESLRLAAASYGIIPPGSNVNVEKQPVDRGSLRPLPTKVSTRLNVPEGQLFTPEGVDKALEVYAQLVAKDIAATLEADKTVDGQPKGSE